MGFVEPWYIRVKIDIFQHNKFDMLHLVLMQRSNMVITNDCNCKLIMLIRKKIWESTNFYNIPKDWVRIDSIILVKYIISIALQIVTVWRYHLNLASLNQTTLEYWKQSYKKSNNNTETVTILWVGVCVGDNRFTCFMIIMSEISIWLWLIHKYNVIY